MEDKDDDDNEEDDDEDSITVPDLLNEGPATLVIRSGSSGSRSPRVNVMYGVRETIWMKIFGCGLSDILDEKSLGKDSCLDFERSDGVEMVATL